MTSPNEIYRATEPFAYAIDPEICVRQEHLDDLASAFAASEHPDFRAEFYRSSGRQLLPQGRLYHLPFRLALGVHDAVPNDIDEAIVVELADQYRSATPLDMQGELRNVARYRRQDRVDAAILGALVEAAVERSTDYEIAPAVQVVRSTKITSRVARMGLADELARVAVR